LALVAPEPLFVALLGQVERQVLIPQQPPPQGVEIDAVVFMVAVAPPLAALDVLAVPLEAEIYIKVQAGAALLGILAMAELEGKTAATARQDLVLQVAAVREEIRVIPLLIATAAAAAAGLEYLEKVVAAL